MCVLLSCSQEEEEEASSRYYVPSYEEVMNTNYAEARDVDQNPRMSISLPSYESLTHWVSPASSLKSFGAKLI